MTDQTDSDRRQDAITGAASNAYRRMRQAAIEIAEAGGAEIHVRMFPGAISGYQRAEPLAGIRATQVLADGAARIRREYTQHARAEGIAWQQIGQALGLDQGPDGKSGYDLAVAAFEHFEGEPNLWHQSNFHYHCRSCGEWITDRGPYESHPEDNEHGHAADCARFAAELATWQAERDAWERGEG
jgi:hypothetical protein